MKNSMGKLKKIPIAKIPIQSMAIVLGLILMVTFFSNHCIHIYTSILQQTATDILRGGLVPKSQFVEFCRIIPEYILFFLVRNIRVENIAGKCSLTAI